MREPRPIHQHKIALQSYLSPCGKLWLASFEERLCLCDWQTNPKHKAIRYRLERLLNATFRQETSPIIKQTIEQLEAYFAQQTTQFTIPIRLVGTEFQQKVWQTIGQIAWGETISYKQLSQKTGSPVAIRAVAQATGANALSIIIPCHRIIGSSSSLVGYAGGLETKRFLLNLESAHFSHK